MDHGLLNHSFFFPLFMDSLRHNSINIYSATLLQAALQKQRYEVHTKIGMISLFTLSIPKTVWISYQKMVWISYQKRYEFHTKKVWPSHQQVVWFSSINWCDYHAAYSSVIHALYIQLVLAVEWHCGRTDYNAHKEMHWQQMQVNFT